MAGEIETVSLNMEGSFAAQASKDSAAAVKLSADLEKLATSQGKSGGGGAGGQKLSSSVGKLFDDSAPKLEETATMLETAGAGLAAAGITVEAAGAVIVAGAAALTAAAGALIYAGIKLGINEATKNEVQGTILDALTKGKGDSAVKVATKVALDIGIDDDTAIERMKKLVNAKFNEGQAAKIIKIGVGIDAALGAGAGDAFAKTLENVKNLGKFDDKSVKKFAKEGISADEVYARLAKTLGISVDAAKAKVKSGTLDIDKGIEAVLGVADKKFGSIADKLGNSIPGLIVKLQVAFKGLFGNIDLGPIKGFLKNVLGVITGPAGQAFSKAFGKLSDTILKMLFGPLGDKSAADKMNAVVNAITFGVTWLTKALTGAGGVVARVWGGIKMAFALGSTVVSAAWNAMKPAVAAIKMAMAEVMSSKPGSIGADIRAIGKDLLTLWSVVKPGIVFMAKLSFGTGLFFLGGVFKGVAAGIKLMIPVMGALARGLSVVLGALASFVSLFTGAGAKTGAAARGMGKAIPQGLVGGILGGMGAALAAAGAMASGVLGRIKSILGVASPAKALVFVGRMNAEGMAKGMNDNADAPKKAGAKLAAGAAAAAAGGAGGGGGGGGGPILNITNNFAKGTTPGEAAAVAGANAEEWKRQMRAWQREQQEGRAA